MKKTKKLLSVLLAVLLISACFVPAAVFAENENCNHDWVLTVTELPNGCISGKGYYECSLCKAKKDAEIPGTEHSWEWVIDEAATPFQSGRKHQHCTVCGMNQNMNTKIPNDPSSGGFADAVARFFTSIFAGYKSIFEQIINNFNRLFKK